jgi:hypothetical protein
LQFADDSAQPGAGRREASDERGVDAWIPHDVGREGG